MTDPFIQACAVGDVCSVEHMLQSMFPYDAPVVVGGIDAMLVHKCHGLTDVLARWGKLHPHFGLSTLSTAFLQGNMTVAGFVLKHMVEARLAESSFNFLFHSGKHLPQSQRAEIAQLILEKSPPSSHREFLAAVVDTGDEHLIDLVCSSLSHITVEKNHEPECIDFWPHFLLCSNAINLAGWGEDNNNDQQRYCTILNKLLMYVDTQKLEHRLALEAVEEPEILDDTVVLQECIQKRQREVLEQAAHKIDHREKTIRRL